MEARGCAPWCGRTVSSTWPTSRLSPPHRPKPEIRIALALDPIVVISNGTSGTRIARAVPYSNEFHPVAFTLKDFKTTPQGGGFSLCGEEEHERF